MVAALLSRRGWDFADLLHAGPLQAFELLGQHPSRGGLRFVHDRARCGAKMIEPDGGAASIGFVCHPK